MKYWYLICLLLFSTASYAVEQMAANLISINSSEGRKLFHVNENKNLVKLMANYTTQETLTYCGIASAVMILNASQLPPPLDEKHAPYRYFTQTNFFNDKVNRLITPAAVLRNGTTLFYLAEAIKTYGLQVEIFYSDKLTLAKFRQTLVDALKADKFVIVNFLRPGNSQTNEGHHSPLAAYDAKTDRFLLLEVARYKYPAFWIAAADLWQGVNTQDGKNSRGFIVISDKY